MSRYRYLIAGILLMPGFTLAQQQALQLDDAWVRALPPMQPTTAAYLSVKNTGTAAVLISGARVEGAGRVEIHTSEEVDGLVRMAQLSTLKLEPGATLDLAPGGTHLMLFDLSAMPKPGDSRELCLVLSEGEPVCTTADVRKSAQQDDHHHHH